LAISWGCRFAAQPVIFFSDLTSGPKTGGKDNLGAFVTVVGKNFGPSRGTNYVSIGGGQAPAIPFGATQKLLSNWDKRQYWQYYRGHQDGASNGLTLPSGA